MLQFHLTVKLLLYFGLSLGSNEGSRLSFRPTCCQSYLQHDHIKNSQNVRVHSSEFAQSTQIYFQRLLGSMCIVFAIKGIRIRCEYNQCAFYLDLNASVKKVLMISCLLKVINTSHNEAIYLKHTFLYF